MLLSIILPIYNVEKYLDRCMSSLLKQELTDCEIILVDDGSTDNCASICDKYGELYSSVKVVHKENGGLSSAREAGLAISEGEYVFWVDSDDWLSENALDKIKTAIIGEMPDIVKFNYFRQTNICEPCICPVKEGIYTEDTIQLLYTAIKNVSKYGFTAWSHVYRKSFIVDKGLSFVSERIVGSEDFLYNFEAYASANSIYVMEDCLYYYELRGGSLSQRYIPDFYIKFNNFYKTLNEWLLCNKHDELIKASRYFYIWRIYGFVSNEYKEFDYHSINDGRKNVKEILKIPEVRECINDALSLETDLKKKIKLLFIKYRLEMGLYLLFK